MYISPFSKMDFSVLIASGDWTCNWFISSRQASIIKDKRQSQGRRAQQTCFQSLWLNWLGCSSKTLDKKKKKTKIKTQNRTLLSSLKIMVFLRNARIWDHRTVLNNPTIHSSQRESYSKNKQQNNTLYSVKQKSSIYDTKQSLRRGFSTLLSFPEKDHSFVDKDWTPFSTENSWLENRLKKWLQVVHLNKQAESDCNSPKLCCLFLFNT